MKFFKKFIRKTFRTSKKMKIKNYLREYLDSLTDSGYSFFNKRILNSSSYHNNYNKLVNTVSI